MSYKHFYILDEEEIEEKRRVTTSRQTIIELNVPAKAVGAVIGRQGANIKKVITFSSLLKLLEQSQADREPYADFYRKLKKNTQLTMPRKNTV